MTQRLPLVPRMKSPRVAFLMLGLAMAATAPGAAGQATLVEPLGVRDDALSASDDSYAEVSLTDAFPSGVVLGGTVYTSMYVSTNGYVTFGHPNASYDADGIAGYTQGPIIAAQFDDWNPGRGGDIYYAQSTGGSGRDAYALVTYQFGLPYTGPVVGSGTNTVQILLRRIGDTASQDFQIELRYVDLNWSGGAPGGSAYSTAGWSFGDQQTYSELAHSGLATFLQTEAGSNVEETGVYRWDVTGGTIQSTPTVTATASASSITGSSAETGGNVSSSGGSTVTDRGVVYATTSGPTLGDASVSSGSGTGSFTATLTALASSTTYYARAYATNTLGTAYGPQITFTTSTLTPPSVSTGAVSAVTAEGATVGGEVTADGGSAVTARGVAYATTSSPTMADEVVASGSGLGAFSAELGGLAPGATYHVRAYATNAVGTAYGAETTLTTERLTQTITFDALEDRAYGDEPLTLTATATSGLSVAYETADTLVATVQDAILTIRGAGSVTITASQSGDDAYQAAEPVERVLIVEPRPVVGGFAVFDPKVYDGSTLAQVEERTLDDVLPADEGLVSLTGGEAHFDDAFVGTGKTVTLGGASLTGARANDYALSGVLSTVGSIVAGPPHSIRFEGPSEALAGEPMSLTLTLLDAHGNEAAATADLGLRVVSSLGDGAGTFDPATIWFAAGISRATVSYVPELAGATSEELSLELVSGTAPEGLDASTHVVSVAAGDVHHFDVEIDSVTAAEGASVGLPATLTITARDAHGNVAMSFTGAVDVGSDVALESGGGRTAAFPDGVLTTHDIIFAEAGSAVLTVSTISGDEEITGDIGPIEVRHLEARLAVSLEVDEERPALGSQITIRVVVENLGWSAAQNVALPDPLAGQDRVEVLEVGVDAGAVDAETGEWSIQMLASGGTATMTIRGKVVVP